MRHPWNLDFTWTDHEGPFQVCTADQVEQFDRGGWFVLPDLLDATEVATVRAEVDGFEAELDELLRSVDGGRVSIAEAGAITFTTHLVARSPLLADLAAHPRLAGLCADLVGPDVRLYWDQAVYKKPEKPRRFPWHQDNGYTFVEPQQYLTCWLALTDATVENGCPWVVPGLHRGGTLRHTFVEPLGYECLDDHPDKCAAEVPAGGVVVFSSLTPHLTGPNTTAEVRKAYILQYAPDGAERLDGDASLGAPTGRTPMADPDRQFPVLAAGRPTERSAGWATRHPGGVASPLQT
jgi:ectoine hydroxylase-related dioxygenase (phytanoyl-CoA dioxygenase family)